MAGALTAAIAAAFAGSAAPSTDDEGNVTLTPRFTAVDMIGTIYEPAPDPVPENYKDWRAVALGTGKLQDLDAGPSGRSFQWPCSARSPRLTASLIKPTGGVGTGTPSLLDSPGIIPSVKACAA